MGYGFYFTHEGKTMQLPVNPEELKITMNGANETTDIIKLGEINRLKGRKLATMEFECFFPLQANRSYILAQSPPDAYIAFFQGFLESTNAGKLVIAGTSISMPCSIESFEWGQISADEDINYKISAKEYKSYSAKVLSESGGGVFSSGNGDSRGSGDGFAVGDLVILNGPYFNTSYGEKPSYTANGMEGQIERIQSDTSRPYRYHICRPQNTARWIGWVSESSMSKK